MKYFTGNLFTSFHMSLFSFVTYLQSFVQLRKLLSKFSKCRFSLKFLNNILKLSVQVFIPICRQGQGINAGFHFCLFKVFCMSRSSFSWLFSWLIHRSLFFLFHKWVIYIKIKSTKYFTILTNLVIFIFDLNKN